MQVRPLSADDAPIYRELRLAALRDHPTAYGTDYREESSTSLEEFQVRLTPSDASVTFGVFDQQALVGIATLTRPTRLRLAFRAMIVGMYVAPSHRRAGCGKSLIDACIDQARSMTGVEEVCLCVTVGNEAARSAYLASGFVPDYVEPRYFKFEGQYYDLEWLRFPLE